MDKAYVCKTCGFRAIGSSPAVLMKHYSTAHPGYRKSERKGATPQAFKAITALEQQIREELLNLEIEREELHSRILAIDNLVAKYKHLA